MPSDYEITYAMITFGGSFVRALGELWRLADPDNQAILKAAFSGLWSKYEETARRKVAEK